MEKCVLEPTGPFIHGRVPQTALKGADIIREAGWAPVPYVQLTHK